MSADGVPFFDPRIFEGFEDGVLVLDGEEFKISYQNIRYRQLWGATPYLQSLGYPYRSIEPSVDDLVKKRSFGHKTIEIQYGSAIRFYHLHLFPVNGQFYVIMSRDITDQFLFNRKSRQYRGLFMRLFMSIHIPVALVDSSGIITKFNPMFFNCFPGENTVTTGRYIWEYFGDDRPKIKELVEELLSGLSSSFEYRNCRFVSVEPVHDQYLCCVDSGCTGAGSWILVFGQDDGVARSVDRSLDLDVVRIQQVASDLGAFLRVLKAIESLPWKAIVAIVVGALVVIGGLDLPHWIEGDQQEQGQ